MLKQDGKTLYLKFKGKVKAEAKIWPDHKYREYEIVDKNLRRVGFVMQLKANQRVDIEVKTQKWAGVYVYELDMIYRGSHDLCFVINYKQGRRLIWEKGWQTL